ncbi:MAG: hypothetical protein HC800_01200 [Phormidesmis sp. RL_2_1]|nr:hypothetical protein [Phormidesmis sp. RL_2_1]
MKRISGYWLRSRKFCPNYQKPPMPVDYDLVILGGTLAGRVAAQTAIDYGARVALVEPPGLFEQRQQAQYLLHGIQQIGNGRQHQQVSQWFQPRVQRVSQVKPGLVWSALVAWSRIAAETQLAALSPAALSTKGVDVILAMPEKLAAHGANRLALTVSHRRLSTRALLAAFGTVPVPLFETALFKAAFGKTLGKTLEKTPAKYLPKIWVNAFLQRG